MCRLIETIRYEEGNFYHLDYHQNRMDESIRTLYHLENQIQLARLVKGLKIPARGLYKFRLVYDSKTWESSFIPYVLKPIRKLKSVDGTGFTYPHKYENRSVIQQWQQVCSDGEEILIVQDGKITDSGYSNVLFLEGDQWITPARPLLKGTMRQYLVDIGKIKERDIFLKEISSFRKCKLINAMLQFNGPEIDVSNIVF